MLQKSGRKITLYKYIWSFLVYIYTDPPDAGVSLNWYEEKKPQVLTHLVFSKKVYIFNYSLKWYGLKENVRGNQKPLKDQLTMLHLSPLI